MAFFEMAKMAVRALFSRPATLMYPARPAKKTLITRGHIVFDGSRCISCSLCMRRCPSQAILMDRSAKEWTIDRFRCVVCSACVDACPVSCLAMMAEYSPPATGKGVETLAITYVKPPRDSATAEEAPG